MNKPKVIEVKGTELEEIRTRMIHGELDIPHVWIGVVGANGELGCYADADELRAYRASQTTSKAEGT